MCGIPHKVVTARVRENTSSRGRPETVVIENARKKARYVSARAKNALVLGFDTVVFLKNRIIGKLDSRAEVRKMLRRYNGKSFLVYTGVTVIDTARKIERCEFVSTKIRMKRMSERRIGSCVDHLGPLDKAGGFSIEGAGSLLFSGIDGCFYNVLGLPISRLDDILLEMGYDLFDLMKKSRRRTKAVNRR